MPTVSSHLDRVLVLIPVRDEAETLPGVLQALRAQGLSRMRVVDNGSTDNSAQIAAAAGAEVISEPRLGYGQACWTGLQHLPADVEWVLFCDGDGSDDLSQLPQFWPLRADYDLILGDRRATPSGRATLTPVQNFGNALATRLIGWGWGHAYGDLGPLRLVRRSLLEAMQMGDRGFGWTVEMQVRAVELDARIAEIPVNYYPRQGGHSKISGTLSGCLQAGIVILTTLTVLYGQYLSRYWQGMCDRLSPAWSGALVVLGCGLMMPFGGHEQVPWLWGGVTVAGLGFVLAWAGRSPSTLLFWGVAMLARLLLLPMEPNSDIWRYLWEGYIQTFGHSPYQLAPTADVLEPLRTDWWFRMNHLEVSAIYPPLTQLGFRVLSGLSPSVLLFKLAFVAADLAICGLLWRRFGATATRLYAWNPVILYSFAGRGHYDSWFILPLVVAWLLLEPMRLPQRPAVLQVGSAIALGMSAAIKWVSLPLLGVVLWPAIRKHKWRLGGLLLLTGMLPLFLSALPYCRPESCPLIPVSSGFVSDGRSAEFFPYWVGLVWPLSKTVNWPYALLFGAIALILILRPRTTPRSFHAIAEPYFFLMLLVSPIVHLWYVTWLIPFSVCTKNLGTRLLSLSAFAYLVLPYRQAIAGWHLPLAARLILWLPPLVGLMWSHKAHPTPQSSTPNL